MDCISVTNQRHGLCMNVWKAPYLLVTENCEQEKTVGNEEGDNYSFWIFLILIVFLSRTAPLNARSSNLWLSHQLSINALEVMLSLINTL